MISAVLITFLFFSFALPQIWIGSKYGGQVGILAVLFVCASGFALISATYRYATWRWANPYLVAPVFLALATLSLLLIHPLANARNDQGEGSDSDEAIRIATERLLSGLPPYAEATYLGNPITPLPGALLLYVPSQILMGSTLLMAPVLLGVTLMLLAKVDKKSLNPLVIALGVSPLFWQSWVTGGDYIVIGLLAFALGAYILSTQGLARLVVPSIFLGLTCASRPTMLLVTSAILLIGIAVARSCRALLAISISLITALIIVLPVYFWDPATFTPFHVVSKAGGTSTGVAAIVLSLAWQLIVFLALLRRRSSFRFATRNLALLLGPAGFLMAIPPALAISSTFMLYYASFTSMLCPLAIPVALHFIKKVQDNSCDSHNCPTSRVQ